MQTVAVEASTRQAAQSDTPSEHTFRVCRRVGRICGLTAVGIGALVVCSNVLELLSGSSNRLLHLLAGHFFDDDTEMALTTGLAFLLCGAALVLLARHPRTPVRRALARLAIGLVALWSVYDVAVFAIGLLSSGGSELYTDVNLPLSPSRPPMSPLTAAIFLNVTLGLLLLSSHRARMRAWASPFALLAALIAAVILLGYGHGVQLLKVVKLLDIVLRTPVALLTAATFAILSAGMIGLVGPDHFPIRPFLGSHSRALLLRSFLPVILAVILLDALFRSHLENHLYEGYAQSIVRVLDEHLSEDELILLVHDKIESNPALLRKVEAWAYTHSEGKMRPLEEASAAELNAFWDQLSPDQKWRRYRRYHRNLQLQQLSMFSALLAALSVAALTLVIGYTARRIGNSIDAAERARDQALDQMRQARDDAEAANQRLRKANEELAKARDAAETANRTKTQFLNNMNHELRTPLTSILLYTEELIHEHQNEAALRTDLQRVFDSGKHLSKLVDDILEHAKLEANMVKLDPSLFSLAKLTQDVAVTMGPLAEKNGNKLVLDCPAQAGEMFADITRVKQCLLNMLSNAAKFTSNGLITLQVVREAIDGHDWVTFRVTDSGIGMTAEQQMWIFERFVQADASTTRRYGGTGLGLTISRGLARLMGGDMDLERSEVNVGSTFTLRLPVGVAAGKAGPPLGRPATPLDPATHSIVLIVDDDATVRDMLVRQLTKEGFAAVSANCGEEALELARQLHPKAITLDVMMPGMDGWSVLSALKSDAQTADIPVVIVSIIDDKNLGYALGATDYLVKPVSRDELLGQVRELVSRGASA